LTFCYELFTVPERLLILSTRQITELLTEHCFIIHNKLQCDIELFFQFALCQGLLYSMLPATHKTHRWLSVLRLLCLLGKLLNKYPWESFWCSVSWEAWVLPYLLCQLQVLIALFTDSPTTRGPRPGMQSATIGRLCCCRCGSWKHHVFESCVPSFNSQLEKECITHFFIFML
jgi:hypothetical protein